MYFFISLSLLKNLDAEKVLAIAIEAPSSEVVFKKSRRLIESGIFILSFKLSAVMAKLILNRHPFFAKKAGIYYNLLVLLTPSSSLNQQAKVF